MTIAGADVGFGSSGGGGLSKWGLESTSTYTNAGDPNGVVTASAAGDLCLDTVAPAVYIATGAGTVWDLVGPGTPGGFPTYTGAGTPEGTQSAAVGESYVDTTNGGLWFKRTGAGNTGWVIGSVEDDAVIGNVTGVAIDNGSGAVVALGPSSGGGVVQLSDLDGFNNSGNAATWQANGTDGLQEWAVTTGAGASGFPSATWRMRPSASGGITDFPGYSIFTHAGDPNGAITAQEEGDLCVDTTSPALWQAAAATDTDWVLVNASIANLVQTTCSFSTTGTGAETCIDTRTTTLDAAHNTGTAAVLITSLPTTIGAGGAVVDNPDAEWHDVDTTHDGLDVIADILVTDLLGMNVAEVTVSGLIAMSGPGQSFVADWSTASFNLLAGTDLSYNSGAQQIISAAGGTFFVRMSQSSGWD